MSPQVAAAVAAAVLAGASRGDAIVLAVLLVALVPRSTTALAVGGALLASSWRWGSASLEALAGAQGVLGPAGGVGPVGAAAGSWLAAVALLLALARRPDPWTALAIGAAASAVVAGPAPGGELPLRVVVGAGLALGAQLLGQARLGRRRLDAGLAVLGAVAGLAAVGAVAPDAPAWPPATELALLVEGAAIALAVGGVTLLGTALVREARWRRSGVPPIVMRSRAGVPARGPARPR